MRKTSATRFLSLLLALAMVLSLSALPVFATDGEDAGESTGETVQTQDDTGTGTDEESNTGGEENPAEEAANTGDGTEADDAGDDADEEAQEAQDGEAEDDSSNPAENNTGTDEGDTSGDESETTEDEAAEETAETEAVALTATVAESNATYVATVSDSNGDISFTDLKAAFDYVSGNATITLLCDTSISYELVGYTSSYNPVTQNITLNLESYTLTISTSGMYIGVESGSSLTINADEGGGIVATGEAPIHNCGGTLIINGGTYAGTTANGAVYVESGTTTINGGTFASTYSGSSLPQGVIVAVGGTTTITDGTFTSTTVSNAVATTGGATVSISGGTFSSDVTSYVSGGSVMKNEDGTYTVGEATTTYVAENTTTSTSYETLQAAIDAASSGDTITLLANTAEDVTIDSEKSITINLGGYTLTNVSGDTITVALGATLTITGSGTVDNVTHAKAAIYNNGTVTLSGGAYTRSLEDGSTNTFYTILNHGAMTINDGVTVLNNGTYSSMIDNGYSNPGSGNDRSDHVEGTNSAQATLTINGGTFTGGKNNVKNDGYGKLNISGGTFSGANVAILNWNVAEITDGTFTSSGSAAVIINGLIDESTVGQLTISGGTFTASGTASVIAEYRSESYGTYSYGTIAISNGTFMAATDVPVFDFSDTNTGTISITGGTYSTAVDEAYCAAGFIPTSTTTTDDDGNETTTYGVTQGTYAATVTASGTTTSYESLDDAIAAANALTDVDSVTVTLLAEVTYSETKSQLTINTTIPFTLEMNGHSITFESTSSYVKIGTSCTEVTIQNSTGSESNIQNTSETKTGAYILYVYGSSMATNITVRNVDLYSESFYAIYYYTSENTTLTLEDCNVSSDATYAIYGLRGNITVTSGNIGSVYATLATTSGNNTYSYAYTFGTDGGSASALTVDTLYIKTAGDELTINSGTYNTVSGTINDVNKISSSVVFYDVSSCTLPAGYTWAKSDETSGTYCIIPLTESTAAAKIVSSDGNTTTLYDNLANATKAAVSGDTVYLLDDYTGTTYVQTTNAGVTIDLNGHSIENTSTTTSYGAVYAYAGSIEDSSNATITIKNSSTTQATITGVTNAVVGSTKSTLTDGVELIIDTTNLTLATGDGNGSSKVALTCYCYMEDSTDNEALITNGGFVVTVDNSKRIYGQFPYAVNAADVSDSTVSVTLLNNYYGSTSISSASVKTSATTVKLDMNGKTWTTTNYGSSTSSPGKVINLSDNRSYEISNGNFVATGKYVCGVYIYSSSTCTANLTLTSVNMTLTNSTAYYFGLVANGSTGNEHTIVLDNSTIDASYCDYGAYFPSAGSLTLKNNSKIIGKYTGIEIRSGDLTITDSAVTTTDSSYFNTSNNNSGSTVTGAAIAISQHTTNNEINVTITNSTISGYYGIFEVNYNSSNTNPVTITITGDKTTVTGNTADAVYSVSVSDKGDISTDATTNSNTTVAISGGSYSTQVDAAYCAEGYQPSEQDENDMYTVTLKDGYGLVENYKHGEDESETNTWTAPTYANIYGEENDNMIFAGWYVDDTCEEAYTDTSGTAYAKFVTLSGDGTNAGIINFLGGSLRKDSEDYTETSLRFGYDIFIPDGVTQYSWKWTLDREGASNVKTVTGVFFTTVYGTYSVNDVTTVPDTNGFRSNMVVTGIGTASYGYNYYSTLKVTYVTADGTTVTVEETEAQQRSVIGVAEAILEENSQDEYASGIQSAYNEANQANE